MIVKHIGKFPGFPPEPVTNYWPYPKALNGWWHALTPTEQKVLDYILRHTWGFNKTADAIAHSQFLKGITKRDGTVVDSGTGIKDEKTIRKSLRGLEYKGFIVHKPIKGEQNIYQLTINPCHEMVVVPENGITGVPKIGTRPLPKIGTHNKGLINNNNSIPVSQEFKNSFKKEAQILTDYLSNKLGCSYPNLGKQTRFAKLILGKTYSVEDIKWAIDAMVKNQWWAEHGFDMKNVADEIPKLMTRTTKGGGNYGQ